MIASPPAVRPPSLASSPGSSPAAELDQPTREGLVGAVIGLGAVLVLLMWWADTSPASLHGAGAWLTAAGRVTGLVGTYLIVVGVLLMGRVTWLDRLIGMDRLAVWHRRIAEYSVSLLVAHAVLIIWGYAVMAHEGVLRETKSVVLSYTDMLAATVGLGLMVIIAVVSARAIRRRISHQAWYFIHLYAYLALALSFAHQFATGADFATHPFNRAAWIALYAGVGLLLLVYRVGKPVRDALRHRLRVAQVVRENPDAVSVYLRGRHLEMLRRRVRPVLLVAIPDPRRLVAGPPLLAVGGAQRPVAAGDGQEPRRSQSRHAPGSAWHPGPGRGPLRRFHLAAPPAAQSAADRRGRRHHAPTGAVRVPARARSGDHHAVPGPQRPGGHVPRRTRPYRQGPPGPGRVPRRVTSRASGIPDRPPFRAPWYPTSPLMTSTCADPRACSRPSARR